LTYSKRGCRRPGPALFTNGCTSAGFSKGMAAGRMGRTRPAAAPLQKGLPVAGSAGRWRRGPHWARVHTFCTRTDGKTFRPACRRGWASTPFGPRTGPRGRWCRRPDGPKGGGVGRSRSTCTPFSRNVLPLPPPGANAFPNVVTRPLWVRGMRGALSHAVHHESEQTNKPGTVWSTQQNKRKHDARWGGVVGRSPVPCTMSRNNQTTRKQNGT
jgi:hypothetical protein